jgi:hypothetical protein
MLQKEYRATRNGLCLLSAFVIAHKCKLYPPLWVLEALAKGFGEYIVGHKKAHEHPTKRKASGKVISKVHNPEPLDSFLQLRPGRGQTPAYKASNLRARNRALALDIWYLNHRFGLTVEEAVDVVLARIEKLGLSDWQLTHERMAKNFSTKWKKDFGLTKERYDYVSQSFSVETWREYLKRFPTDNLEGKLKAKLKLSQIDPSL